MRMSPESSQATWEVAGKVIPKPDAAGVTFRVQDVVVDVPGRTQCEA